MLHFYSVDQIYWISNPGQLVLEEYWVFSLKSNCELWGILSCQHAKSIPHVGCVYHWLHENVLACGKFSDLFAGEC